MELLTYTPEHFPLLRRAAERLGEPSNLGHRVFVDHYYASSERCRLYLLLDGAGEIACTLGVEEMHLARGTESLRVGTGSNYFSLQPGLGGLLFHHWLRTYPRVLTVAGSADTHRILKRRGWPCFRGVRTFFLHPPIETYDGDPPLRRAAKTLARAVARALRPSLATAAARRVERAPAALAVREEAGYSEDLLPRRTPFPLRFAPDVEHLRWRYGTRLPFAWYRPFRLLRGSETAGYVILREMPEGLVVAHCDGEQPRELAWGVLLSLAAGARGNPRLRWAEVVSSHREMQGIFTGAGFRPVPGERPLIFGRRKGPVGLPADTSRWLVGSDWGDVGFIGPLRDQPRGG